MTEIGKKEIKSFYLYSLFSNKKNYGLLSLDL